MPSKKLYGFTRLSAEGGRVISGTLIKYGAVANFAGFGRESVAPGAFGDVEAQDVVLNVAHDRGRPLARTGGAGLEMHDSQEMLTIRATLPDTREGDDTLALINTGVLRGLSAGYGVRESHAEGNINVTTSAVLQHLSVVDKGAYPGSGVQIAAWESDTPPEPDEAAEPPQGAPARHQGRRRLWL